MMFRIRLHFSLRTMFVAIFVVGMLFGGLVWFVKFLAHIPQGVALVSKITPSASGENVCVRHGTRDI